MKRLIYLLLLVVLVSPLLVGAQEDDASYIGVVTYKVDGLAWKPANYVLPINSDLQVYPLDPEAATSREVPEVDPPLFRLMLKEAFTVADQIAAIDELVAAGVSAMIITPGPDAVGLRDRVAALAQTMPVAVTTRVIPELDLPFYGVDMFDFGLAAGEGADRGLRPTFIIGDFSDGLQASFLDGFSSSENFVGSFQASGDGYDVAAQAIQELDEGVDLNDVRIVVTNPQFVPGAIKAIDEKVGGTDFLIQLASIGAPENWRQLFDEKKIHAVYTWDTYPVLLWAGVNLKMNVLESASVPDFFSDVMYFRSTGNPVFGSYPYSRDNPNRLSRFWR